MFNRVLAKFYLVFRTGIEPVTRCIWRCYHRTVINEQSPVLSYRLCTQSGNRTLFVSP
jgi:hypothetical protein